MRWKSWPYVLVVIALVGSIAVVPVLVFGDWETRGQFGDSFGAATALLNAVVLLALLFTVDLQRRDSDSLAQQVFIMREELKAGELARKIEGLILLRDFYRHEVERLGEESPNDYHAELERLRIEILRMTRIQVSR